MVDAYPFGNIAFAVCGALTPVLSARSRAAKRIAAWAEQFRDVRDPFGTRLAFDANRQAKDS